MTQLKPVTPMARLKAAFVDFNKVVCRITGEPVELNKAQSRSIPWPYHLNSGLAHTKGVKSDFIRFYTTSKDTSFGFVFAYLDEVEESIQFTVKHGDDIRSSQLMSVATLRRTLNAVTGELSALHPFSHEKLMRVLNNAFMDDQVMDTDHEVAKGVDEVKVASHELQEGLAAASQLYTHLGDELRDANLVLRKEVDALPESQRLQALREEMARLEALQSRKKAVIKKRLGISEMKRQQEGERAKMTDLTYQRDALLNEIVKQKPAFLAPRIKEAARKAQWWEKA